MKGAGPSRAAVRTWAGALSCLALACSGESDLLVRVVAGDEVAQGLTALEIEGFQDGGFSRAKRFELDGRTLPQTVLFVSRGATTGNVSVRVRGMRGDCVAAAGSGAGVAARGQPTPEVEVELVGPCEVDGGACECEPSACPEARAACASVASNCPDPPDGGPCVDSGVTGDAGMDAGPDAGEPDGGPDGGSAVDAGDTVDAGGDTGSDDGGAGDGGGADAGGACDGGACPAVETCTNNLDDDGDGLADCEDSDCIAFTCLRVINSGWSGPLRIRRQLWGVPDPIKEPCPDGGDPVRYFEDPVGTAVCTACACGPMSGAACGPAGVSCVTQDLSCGGATDWTSYFASSLCLPNLDAPANGQVSCTVGATPVALGSCVPSGGTLNPPKPFGRVIDACPDDKIGGGCGPFGFGTYACVNRKSESADRLSCVFKSGTGSCPADWPYKLVPLPYTDGTDSRSCTPCACTATPDSVTCSNPSSDCPGSSDCYVLHAQTADCSDVAVPRQVFTSAACTPYDLPDPAPGATWSLERLAAAPAGGGCDPSGGNAFGTVTTLGTHTVTFCCRPPPP